jgi:hypothetical protein
MPLDKEDEKECKVDLLHIAWLLSEGFDHECGIEVPLNPLNADFDCVGFDGRTLWVNFKCGCGEELKLAFQMTDIEKGAWKDDEIGPVKIEVD